MVVDLFDGAVMLLSWAVRGLHGPQALFARTWSSGGMALWMALMLAIYLLVVFV